MKYDIYNPGPGLE